MDKENSSTTEKRKPKKQKYFVDSWLSDPIFKNTQGKMHCMTQSNRAFFWWFFNINYSWKQKETQRISKKR